LQHRLAEQKVREAGNLVGRAWAHVFIRDDLEQLREARRIEELKKCVIMKSRRKLSGMPADSVAKGSVDVLEDTIEPDLRLASILR
jgi:hypothetical protein